MRQFTKKYIKMAEMAEELQKSRPELEIGYDYIYCSYCEKVHHALHEDNDMVWLPLEHQLWEMYLKSLSKDEQESCNIEVVMLDDFQEFVLEGHPALDGTYKVLMTLWQLLLAFVMHELYGKRWDDDKEEWVKQ